MRVLLLQLDGKNPNLALMKISAHHKRLGHEVTFQHVGNPRLIEPGLWDNFDRVYASLIFQATRPLALRLLEVYPDAIIGGSGWDLQRRLPELGITTLDQDYSIYPRYMNSIGYTQRGCRFNCRSYCLVPIAEGRPSKELSVWKIYRGEPYPRNVVLLDNDFFWNERSWREEITAIREGGFRVCFTQGINARVLNDETAEAVASVPYYDSQFKRKRIYTAWDNQRDEERLFKGLEALVRYGVKPDEIMVYMLIGHWPAETAADRLYRQSRLRKFGARPYPMPFVRTPELVGFQRWVIGAYDKRVSWQEWAAAGYRPEKLRRVDSLPLFGEPQERGVDPEE